MGTLDFRSEPLDLAWIKCSFLTWTCPKWREKILEKIRPLPCLPPKQQKLTGTSHNTIAHPPSKPRTKRLKSRDSHWASKEWTGHIWTCCLYLDTKVFASFAQVYLSFLHDQDYIMYIYILYKNISYRHSIHAFLWSIDRNYAVLSPRGACLRMFKHV